MASSTPFRPYGLIKSPIEQALYRRAHIANIYSGIADPKEYETVALMQSILHNNFSTWDNFSVSSQQPPTPTSARRCDLVVSYLENDSQDVRALCFAECKRTSTSQAFSLIALEEQAYEYCKLYVDYQNVSFVYAATMAGAHIRLWTCWAGKPYLVPFWGSIDERNTNEGNQNKGNWQEYKDVGNDSDGRDIQRWLERMKEFPPTPHAGQTSDSYGTSGQGIPLSYQVPAPSRQLAPSGYPFGQSSLRPGISGNVSSPGYQLGASGTRPGPYNLSFAPPRSATEDTYMRSYPTAQVPPSIQSGGMIDNTDESEGNGEDDGVDEGAENEGDEDDGEGAAASRTESMFRVVRISKKTHTFGSTEYIFVDAKGKARSTRRNQWVQITYNGRPCWKYHHYVCLENVFS